jgi:histidinol-phosphate/aromatic aminotransferase/cobyric acid decarboxylase-like protein
MSSPTRRNFFRKAAAGAAITGGLLPFADLAFSELVPASKASESGGPIILSRNENAYGPSQKVIACMQDSLQFANRYPDPAVAALHERIAQSHSVRASGPRLRFRRDFEHHCRGVSCPRQDNPTGTFTPRKDLESFIRKLPPATTVLIDEAYHHYVEPTGDYSSFIDHPMDDDRVVVCRTFSKVFGLAGIRVGYAVGAPERIRALAAHRLPEGLNAVGARAALVAYNDLEYVQMSAKRNSDDRQEFFNQANARMVKGIDSHTNFAMLQTSRDAVEVIEHFKKNNVQIARLFPSMHTYIRVSFGTPQEMKEFWRVWGLMPPGKMEM